MAHFAQLENNKITQVIVVNNEVLNNEDFPASEALGVAFCKSLYGDDTEWVQTSYNSNFRKNFAAKGGIYDSARDAFIPPKPSFFNEDDWILNEETCQWELDPNKPL